MSKAGVAAAVILALLIGFLAGQAIHIPQSSSSSTSSIETTRLSSSQSSLQSSANQTSTVTSSSESSLQSLPTSIGNVTLKSVSGGCSVATPIYTLDCTADQPVYLVLTNPTNSTQYIALSPPPAWTFACLWGVPQNVVVDFNNLGSAAVDTAHLGVAPGQWELQCMAIPGSSEPAGYLGPTPQATITVKSAT